MTRWICPACGEQEWTDRSPPDISVWCSCDGGKLTMMLPVDTSSEPLRIVRRDDLPVVLPEVQQRHGHPSAGPRYRGQEVFQVLGKHVDI